MKIIRLTAENVKRLKVVDITASSGLNQVTGKNGSGKTSVLDSIWWALGGKDGIQSVPIRKGTDKAKIRLDLGELIVERRFSESGTTISVKTSEGAAYPSPQAMLDAMLGELSFDPLAFSRMSAKEQVAELRRIAKVDLDLDEIEALNKTDFASRTEINRQAKAKRAHADGIQVPTGLPTERIDESELLNRMQAAAESNAAIETQKARREQARRDIADRKAESERLRDESIRHLERTRERVSELQMQLADFERKAKEQAQILENTANEAMESATLLEDKLMKAEPLPIVVDVSDIRVALDNAKTINAGIAARERRDQISAEAAELETLGKSISDRMADRERSKIEALSAAQMPLEGLALTAAGVAYNGLPFDQASDAEQLRVSCSIAMAANSKLRVVRIKDGSLLDEDGIRLISELAAEKDYQVWVERVESSGKVGIVMVDGEVKQ